MKVGKCIKFSIVFVFHILPLFTVSYINRASYSLTYSMVQSLSWEANWFAASQEIPRISRNLKVHYRIHKHPPPISILGQPNPVHIPTSHLLEIHPNIIHPSMPRSPQWFPSLRQVKNCSLSSSNQHSGTKLKGFFLRCLSKSSKLFCS